MGTGLSDSGNAGRIPRASLIPRYRLRLAHARRLGLATSPDSTSIWPYVPKSSLGCAVFDSVIATWFLLDAPSFCRGTAATISSKRGSHAEELSISS